jgi:hypothetical protein
MSDDRINLDVQLNPVFKNPVPSKFDADMDVHPRLDKRLITDDNYWKTPLSADIAISSMNMQKQLDTIQKQLRTAHANIDVQLNLKPADIQALVDKIQAEFKKSSNIELFNRDTKVSGEHVRAYMTKFFTEVKKVIEANSDSFSLDFKANLVALEEQFLRFRAQLNLDIPIKPVDFTSLETGFNQFVGSLQSELSRILPESLDTFFNKFDTEVEKLPDSFNEAVNEMRKSIDGLASDMQAVQVPPDALAQLEKAYNEFILRLSTLPANIKISDESADEIQKWISLVRVDLDYLKIASPDEFVQALEDIHKKSADLVKLLNQDIDASKPTQRMREGFESILATAKKITGVINSWLGMKFPEPTMPEAPQEKRETRRSERPEGDKPSTSRIDKQLDSTVGKFKELDKELENKVKDFQTLDGALQSVTEKMTLLAALSEKSAQKTEQPKDTPPLPFEGGLPQPAPVTVDTSGLAADLTNAILRVNVVDFLTKKQVGRGWDAIGGGSGGGGKSEESKGKESKEKKDRDSDTGYRDFESWIDPIAITADRFTSWLEVLVGSIRESDATFGQFTNDAEKNNKIINKAFEAMRNADFSNLSADENKALERILTTNGVSTSGTELNDLIKVIERLTTYTRAEDKRGADTFTNMTEYVKIFGDASARLDELQRAFQDMDTDHEDYDKVASEIEELVHVLKAKSNAITSVGFKEVAGKAESQTQYVARRIAEEEKKTGAPVSESQKNQFFEEWLTNMNKLEQAFASSAPKVKLLTDNVDRTISDLSDPEKWKGVVKGLETAIGEVDKIAKGFSSTLSKMGFEGAAQGLDQVMGKIQGGVDRMRQVQDFSKTLMDWGSKATKLGKAGTAYTRLTGRAAGARKAAQDATAIGDTVSAARHTKLAGQFEALAAQQGKVAKATSGLAGALSRVGPILSKVGSIASKIAGPLAVLLEPLMAACEVWAQRTAAITQQIKAHQRRLDDQSDVRMLTTTNTAAVTVATQKRAGANDVEAWNKQNDLLQSQTTMFTFALDASEKLIALEMERLRKAEDVARVNDEIANKQIEGRKEMEMDFKKMGEQGQQKYMGGWYSSATISDNGEIENAGDSAGGVFAKAFGAAVAGAAVGATVGAVVTAWSGPGAAITALGGAVTGAIIGGVGSILGDLTSQAMSTGTENSASFRRKGAGWFGNKEMLNDTINAGNARMNRELSTAANANLDVLNAPLNRLAQQFENFGKYLPKEELDLFKNTLTEASKANVEAAKTKAMADKADEIGGLSDAEIKNRFEIKNQNSWTGGSYSAGYQVRIGTEEIFARTIEEFRRKVDKARENLEKASEAGYAKAKQDLAASDVINHMGSEMAQYTKVIEDAKMAQERVNINLGEKVMSNATDASQGYRSMATNHRTAVNDAQFEISKEERKGKVAEVRKQEMAEVVALEKKLAADLTRGAIIADSEVHKQKMANIEAERQAAEKRATNKTTDERLAQMDEDFERTLYNARIAREEDIAQRRRDFAIDEQVNRMKDGIAYEKQAIDAETHLHKTRLDNIKQYADARMKASEAYTSKALETFASGRGTNPLEEQKKMTLAAMDMENEEKKAKRRMEQEMKIANMRSQQELEIARIKMNVDANNREAEMKFQIALTDYKADMDEKLMWKHYQKERKFEEDMAAYKKARDEAWAAGHPAPAPAPAGQPGQPNAGGQSTPRVYAQDFGWKIGDQAGSAVKWSAIARQMDNFNNPGGLNPQKKRHEILDSFEKTLEGLPESVQKVGREILERNREILNQPGDVGKEVRNAMAEEMRRFADAAMGGGNAVQQYNNELAQERQTLRAGAGEKWQSDADAIQVAFAESGGSFDAFLQKVQVTLPDAVKEYALPAFKAMTDAVGDADKIRDAAGEYADLFNIKPEDANKFSHVWAEAIRNAIAQVAPAPTSSETTPAVPAPTDAEKKEYAKQQGIIDPMDTLKKEQEEKEKNRPEFNMDDHSKALRNANRQGNQSLADAQRKMNQDLHNQQMKDMEEEHKHSLTFMVERAKKERELNKEIYADKFRAQLIGLEMNAESTQRSTDTNFATSIFGAKSGQDRMKALAQYQTDSQYNAQKTQLEQKHATEIEQLEQQGATEEQRARLKQQQEREKGELDQAKSFKDAIVNALGSAGTLRDIAKEEGVGQKSDGLSAHERIRSSAFAHIKDPAADAVKHMERQQMMQHNNLMQFMMMHIPPMLNALQSQGNAMTMNTVTDMSYRLGGGPF